MSEYSVKSEGSKHFSLSKAGKEIGRLSYEKWFSFKAEMILEQTKTYQIETKGFWRTTIELKQNGKVLLNFKMNRNGNIIIKTWFDETERDFIFKQKGLLKNSYVLLDKEERELLDIQPDFKFRKFSYDYNISAAEGFDNFWFNEILLLITIHCANYYMTMISSVLAATV